MKLGWEERRLGDLCSKIGSGATPKGGNESYKDEGISLFRSLNVHDLEFRPKDLAKIDDAQAQALANVEVMAGDVLLNITGASVARCCVAPVDFLPARVNQHVSILRPNPQALSTKFLAYLLVSKEMKERLLDIGVEGGATRQALTKAQLQDFLIPLPPVVEQSRIVAVLDAAFEGLTRARAHIEANLQNSRELFESFVRSVVDDCESQYEAKSLSAIAENLDRLRVPITKGDRVAGDIPYYGASGIVDYVANHLFDEELLLVSEDGANLLARSTPIAFSINGKTWVNNHAHVLRFSDRNAQEFVSLYLNSISIKPFVSGMAQPKLNQQELNRIPIPMPSPTACAEIVSKAEALISETSDLQSQYRAKLAELDDLRQSLLQKAFAGELT